ncbi:MAG TPA: hypothetical protein VNU97_05505 [Rhizomicrobium sp.]|nr:hypothetical protein [Rhizomicrobium sp.]
MSPGAFHDPLTETIAGFLREIGLEVRIGEVREDAVLPGIRIDHGALVVEEARLAHPGDLLHEAGHLAVVPPARRARFHHDVGNDGGEEMAVIAWSYAAALHLGLDPAIVFHDAGYRGDSASILENFTRGYYFGVPMLDLGGLAYDLPRAAREGLAPYPKMRRWLRQA